MVTLQKNYDGLFVSDLIEDRYQILESSINRSFYVYDHSTESNLVSSADSTLYFDSVEEAERFIRKTPIVKKKVKSYVKTVTKKQSVRKETALSLMRNLILNSNLNDEEIAQKILETYPASTYNKSMVKFQRKNLVKVDDGEWFEDRPGIVD